VNTIAGPEVAQFLADARNRFSNDILDSQLKKLLRIRLGILGLMVILGIVLGYFAYPEHITVLIIVGIVAIKASRVCFYYSFKGNAKWFSRELVEWIRENRGPLYAKGIRPRPGYGGVLHPLRG
jgi:hypothetical protein